MWVLRLILVLLMPAVAAAQASLADFEADASASVQARSARIETVKADDAPQGKQFLRLQIEPPGKDVSLTLTLPDAAGFARHQQMTASLRAADAKSPVRLRWVALDADRHPIFQRRFQLPPGEQWSKLEEPLREWRWDTHFVGAWADVKYLELRIDAADTRQIDLDDVRLDGDATPDDRSAWLLSLAFENRPIKKAQADGFLVATDAVDAFSPQDLNRMLEDMRRVRAFLRRLFGPAVHPTDDLGPAALLIFSDEANDQAFFQRLGTAWRAQIAAGTQQGYTVQDIATGTYKKERGVRRPVYLHESVHAIVARDLRILTADDADTPLQEGLANYIQLCVFPQSVNRKTYTDNFTKPIDPSGNGFFKPLEQLFSTRTTAKEYAQVASVVAYLIEKDQPLLRELVKGLAADQTAADVLKSKGISWEKFQNVWLTWGRQRFPAGSAGNAIFAPPPEFRAGG